MPSDTDSSPSDAADVDNTLSLDQTPRPRRVISKPDASGKGALVRNDRPRSPESSGEEQALEWHEVIELQAFSERKAWIEEKIRFLEKMPPIEVFVGLDAVRASADEIPGLPTRAELQQWLVEHDRIEKETEIFDSGELRKLKKFTKAATQRTLSPADTDLIELTLTTIYELDKLLHLLRDRSDSLELLGTRLAWEERRIGAWAELRSIVEDLQQFLETRARWCPAVYERAIEEDHFAYFNEASGPFVPTLRRKGSISSLASAASDSTISSLSMSRGDRFKLAEMLSRDAAQFASRVSSLKHSKISAAGKALDKLIDDSRKPVPDELLDEQDRLEDKGINEMEDIGKFVMSAVMQWKKADEIYVETAKDKSAAQTLLEEIEIAKLHHPSSRQDTAFLSRSSALAKRLRMRENPSSPHSLFPRPTHQLFPDQSDANREIIQTLASELAFTQDQVKEAEIAAKEYHAVHEAVKRIEKECKTASDLSDTLESLSHRLERGVESASGDGSPPSLSSETCLQSHSHSVFLALLPALLDELQRVDQAAERTISTARHALADLPRSGVDEKFVRDSAAVVNHLDASRASITRVRETVVHRVATLQKTRTVWSAMATIFDKMDGVRYDIIDIMRKQMHRQQANQNAALLTPESPASPLSIIPISPHEAEEQLDALFGTFQEEVTAPLVTLSPSLGPALGTYLSHCSAELVSTLQDIRHMARSWGLVQRQAVEMDIIRDETHALQMRSEHLKLRYDGRIQELLEGVLSGDENVLQIQGQLSTAAQEIRQEIQSFQDSLFQRVPFVGTSDAPAPTSTPASARRRFSVSTSFGLDVIRQAAQAVMPFDLAALDRAVRNDANSYSMLLASESDSLMRKTEHFRLARVAQDIDNAVASIWDSLREAVASLEASQLPLDDAAQPLALETLTSISEQVDRLYEANAHHIASACVAARTLLEHLEEAASRDTSLEPTISLARKHAVEDVEEKYNLWRESVEVLSERLSDMRHAEQERLAVEARVRHEEELILLEEQARLEKDRLEEAARIERERAEVGARLAQERLAREQAEAESQKVEAAARAEEQRRRQVEAERILAEEQMHAEVTRLEEERQLEQLKLAEEHTRAEEERIISEQRVKAEVASDTARADDSNAGLPSQLSEPASDLGIKSAHAETVQSGNGPTHQSDLFGLVTASTGIVVPEHDSHLQGRILKFRKQLRSLNINEIARVTPRESSSLPTAVQVLHLQTQFDILCEEVATLPSNIPSAPSVETELRSLRAEIEGTTELLGRIHALANLASSVQTCDNALSDLLEHIDSYPSSPTGALSSCHASDPSLAPEEQMSARLTFTQDLVDQVIKTASSFLDDSRVTSERGRIAQTWEELQAMGVDRVNGQKSRPPSVISSGRNSQASTSHSSVARPSRGHESKKSMSYSKLSAAPSGSKYLAPPPATRRSTSGTSSRSRSSSRASAGSNNRSVSGPIHAPTPSANSRLFQTTFASRQRSSSISSTAPTARDSTKPPTPTIVPSRAVGSRPRARTGQSSHERTGSPLVSDIPRSQSRSSLNVSRPSLSSSRSTWARAPRQSFPNIPISPPPKKSGPAQKKPYVPNPKNKLDMAVGDVVNNLPVNINIEVVADTWKDQSGKYWIGDEDPKLCFCRILRSQTVMVRVGGGWTELSKFIKEHIADAFRLLPDSPPRVGAPEENWISSATLSQAMKSQDEERSARSPPLSPRTPEPTFPHFPAFALSTPHGTSPRSVKSSSPGSPLQPMQFIRRVERESLPGILRPETPSKPSRASSVLSHLHTPKQPAWRP